MILLRRTALIASAAPATPRRTSASQSVVAKPQIRRDLVDAPCEEVLADHLPGFASYRISDGIAATRSRQPATQAIPPETIEKRRLVSDASAPASRLPSRGALVTCAR